MEYCAVVEKNELLVLPMTSVSEIYFFYLYMGLSLSLNHQLSEDRDHSILLMTKHCPFTG